MRKLKNPSAGSLTPNDINVGRYMYQKDLERYNDVNGPTLTYLQEHPDFQQVKSTLGTSDMFNTYENAPTLDDDSGILDYTLNALDYVTGMSSKAKLLKNGLNYFGKRWVDDSYNADLADLYDINTDLKDLEFVLDYLKLKLELYQIQSELRDNKNADADRLSDRYEEIVSKIKEYDDYFMGEGRSHKVVLELMYDADNMNAADVVGSWNKSTRRASKQILDFIDSTGYKGPILNKAAKTIGTGVASIVGHLTDLVDHATAFGHALSEGDWLHGDSGISQYTEYIKNRYVESLDKSNPADLDAIRRLYKGIQETDAYKSPIDSEKIKNWKSYNEDLIREKVIDIDDDINDMINGTIWGIKGVFDPNISKDYIAEQEEWMAKPLWRLALSPINTFLYSIPEIASTVGLFKYLLGAMGYDVAVTKGLGLLARRHPWLATAQAVALIPNYVFPVAAAELSREEETALEKIEGVTSRVIQNSLEGNRNLPDILNILKSKLKSIGYNVDALDEQQLLKLGIAHDIQTGDPTFETEKREARKGINTLIGANNALAAHDYLQSLAFMSYGGSALNKFVKHAGELIADTKLGTLLSAVKRNTVGKVASKFFNDDLPKGFLHKKHLGDWLIKRLALLLGEGITEGGEEVVQEILLSRYQRGLYDDVNSDKSMIPVDGIFRAVGLAGEAIPDYLGLHPWDPELSTDNILRAFNVGFLSSMYFSGALRGASNIWTADNENLRGVVSQMKSDNVISRLVGEYYNQVQDQLHMSLFYDAMQKFGVNYQRLSQALRDLKGKLFSLNKDITDEAIDNDLLMLRNMNFAMTSDMFNENFKEEGINRKDPRYKLYVIDAAKKLTDLDKSEETVSERRLRLGLMEESRNNIARLIYDLIEARQKEELDGIAGTVASETLEYENLKKQFPKLFEMVQYFSRKFDVRGESSIKGSRKQRLDKAISFFTEISKDEDKTITSTELVDAIADELGYTPEITEVMELRKNNDPIIKRAIRKAAEQKVKQDWKSSILGKREFMSSAFTRQAAINSGASNVEAFLSSAYDNESMRDDLLNKAYDLSLDRDAVKRSYVLNHIALFVEASQAARVKYIQNVTRNQEELLDMFKRITGLDLDVRRLKGIRSRLDDQLKQLLQREKLNLNPDNTPGYADTYEKYFEKDPVSFDDQEEYDRLFGEYSLMHAIKDVQQVLAAAYKFGAVNPESLEKAFYNVSENNPISAISREYRKRKAEQSVEMDEEVTQRFDPLKQHDLYELSKKAAWAYIKDLLYETEERRKIANRRWEEETPMTSSKKDVQEALEESENESSEKQAPEESVESGQQQQEEQNGNQASNIPGAQMSDSEKNLRLKYNNEKLLSEKKAEEIALKLIESERKRAEKEKTGEEEPEPTEQPEVAPQPAAEEQQPEPEPEPAEEVPEAEQANQQAVDDTPPAPPAVDSPSDDDRDKDEDQAPHLDPSVDLPENSSDVLEPDVLQPEPILEPPVDTYDPSNDPLDVYDLDSPEIEPPFEGFSGEVDPLSVVYKDGLAFIVEEDGEQWTPLDYLFSDALLDEAKLQLESEGATVSLDEVPNGNMSLEEKVSVLDHDDVSSIVSSTFFYNPFKVLNKKNGKKEELTVLMVVGEELLKFRKPIASGVKLAKKLIQPGWLASTNKFYVVSDPIKRHDKKLQYTDDRDMLTVAIALEDDENTYLVFLRPLYKTISIKDQNSYIDNTENDVLDYVLSYGANWRAVAETLGLDETALLGENATTEDKISAYKRAVAKLVTENLTESWEKARKTNKTLDKAQYIRKYWESEEDRVRQSLAHKNRKIYSRSRAKLEVEKLRNFRNQIIDKYATVNNDGTVNVPKEVRYDVIPVSVRQSNGKFDNLRNDTTGLPEYRSVTGKDSLEEILTKLENGTLQIGFGRGLFASKNNRYKINDVLHPSKTTFGGKGLSGKLYWMVRSLFDPSVKVPVMLAEEKFNSQVRLVNGKSEVSFIGTGIKNPVICLELDIEGNWVNTNKKGYLPSAAEILFLLLTRLINLGTTDDSIHQEIIELFIHSGQNTLAKNQPKLQETPIALFLSKLLWYGILEGESVPKLHIAITRGDSVQYKSYTQQQLQDPQVKMEVINALATLFHWNTDIDFMSKAMYINTIDSSALSTLFSYMIRQHTGKLTADSKLSLFGCPLFTFRLGDFMNVVNGLAQPKKGVSYLAWMLKNQKVKTDVSPDVFFAPYVFANGVAVKGAQDAVDTSTHPVDGNDEVKEITNPIIYKDLNDVTVLPEGEELQEAMLEASQSMISLQNGGTSAIYVLKGVDPDKILLDGQEEIEDAAKQKIKEALDIHNKKHGTSYDIKDLLLKINVRKMMLPQYWATGLAFIRLELFNNGKFNVTVRKNEDVDNAGMIVTGAFSKTGGLATIDAERERDWICETLGIDKSNVVVTNAVMKSMSGEDVFGVTNVVTNVITGTLMGVIKLSSRGNKGMGYHEAWHYVNLLIHDTKTRRRIYEAYAKANGLYKPGVKLRDIEEHMADAFAKDVMLNQDTTLLGSTRRLWRNILDFILVTGNRKLYRSVFNAILTGKYKKYSKLDDSSVLEFRKAYDSGVFATSYVPGYPKEVTDNLKHIDHYYQLLDGMDAVVRRIFANIPFATQKELEMWASEEGLEIIMGFIDEMIEEQSDEKKADRLRDIKNNKDYLFENVIAEFNKYGYRVKRRKSDKQPEDVSKDPAAEENEDPIKKEEKPENTWDKFALEYSRSENVSNHVKFFLSRMPQYKKVWMPNGKSKYIVEIDDYNTPLFFDLDKTIRKLHKDLWWITSFGELETNPDSGYIYKRTSLMGAIERRKNSLDFYYSMYEYLSKYALKNTSGSAMLRSELFNAINSSKQNIDLLTISNPKQRNFSGLASDEVLATAAANIAEEDSPVIIANTDKAVADRHRIWSFLIDEFLTAARNTLKLWSKNLAASSFLSFNEEKQDVSVDPEFTKIVADKYNSLHQSLNSKDAINNLRSLRSSFIDLMNTVGIDCDLSSLGIFLNILRNDKSEKIAGKQMTDTELVELMKSAIDSGDVGSIGDIIQGIALIRKNKSGNKKRNQIGGRELDEIFTGYSDDSQIHLLAVAWDSAYPSPQDFSVKDANGNRLYPVNLNSHFTDRINWLNTPETGYADQLKQSAYSLHSLLATVCADQVDENDPSTKIKARAFVGIRDDDTLEGGDYFGITPQEDYIAKMMITERNCLLSPTMADKKSWDSIQSPFLKLSHSRMWTSGEVGVLDDTIIEEFSKINPYNPKDKRYGGIESRWWSAAFKWYDNLEEDDPIKIRIKKSPILALKQKSVNNVGYTVDVNTGTVMPKFDFSTLNIFAGYVLDEINALIGYYSVEHIKEMMSDNSMRLDNFSGTVDSKTGLLNCDGNGGFFRYFYDILDGIPETYHTLQINGNDDLNLNHHIQALFELLKKIRSGEVDNVLAGKSRYNKVTESSISKDGLDYDGFELIRQFLSDLKNSLFGENEQANDYLLNLINKKLVNMAYEELEELSTESSPLKMAKYDEDSGLYIPTGVPELLLRPYIEDYIKSGMIDSMDTGDLYKNAHRDKLKYALGNAFFSLIANHVANTAISIIEVEKVITGDPAYFKRKLNPDDKKSEVQMSIQLDKNTKAENVTLSVNNILDTFSDKIKRLGGTMSPGSEIRPDYSEWEIALDPTLKNTKYTNLVVEDLIVPSAILKTISNTFETQLIVDVIRTSNNNYIDKIRKHIVSIANDKSIKLSDEDVINAIYRNKRVRKFAYDSLKDYEKSYIKNTLNDQVGPYTGITVSDAQVFIRPALYRKIRIGLGLWLWEKDADGYSDEIAYNLILNGNGTEWMSDPKAREIVSKFELYALKMSYYQNDIVKVSDDFSYMKPIYDKMAIFPMFKYMLSTDVGEAIYNRMNKKDNELDMISFKSAVKVGAPAQAAQLMETTKSKAIKKLKEAHLNEESYSPTDQEIADAMESETILSKLSKQFLNNSNKYIDQETGDINDRTGDDLLTVEIQDLKNLRMQLNTEAHEADERAIGTLMFKIAFSNIIDDTQYGLGKSNHKIRLGSEIKKSIMRNISALTLCGVLREDSDFYENGKLSYKKVKNFLLRIVDNNNLGDIAKAIINDGGVVSSLVKREVFEMSTSSHVNKDIVEIHTNGGTAIQQSMFGFAGYGSSNVGIQYNGGRELKWNAKEGSMEVILSMNLLRSALPSELKDKSFTKLRQWLIDNDVILGSKSDGSQSDPKPFGIGYRIPTQGMSSMFSFIVADVIPEQSGDLIIVPREFTALTGSDFDVDKLYLSTFAYSDGERLSASDEELSTVLGEDPSGIDISEMLKKIANNLLLDYIDLVSDEKNFANARASIDAITNVVKDNFLKRIRPKKLGYITGMTELMPSFLSRKKMEFKVGKDGISPFALSIPHLAMTQFTHLTINFGSAGKAYDLNPLDRIYGNDKLRISDWLSAMVNAHVDVAKDSYVFDLNLNNNTYNHAVLLLRAGKGLSTFSFLAQPLLKEFSDAVNNAGGVYGRNMDGLVVEDDSGTYRKNIIRQKLMLRYVKILKDIATEHDLYGKWKDHIEYLEYLSKDKDSKKKSKKQSKENGDTDYKLPEGFEKKLVFDIEEGIRSINNFVYDLNKVNSKNAEDFVESLIFNLHCLIAYQDLNKYARTLNELVLNSQIDTKKFGKTFYEKINFENRLYTFINNSQVFTVTDQKLLGKLTKDLKKSDNDEYDPKDVSREVLMYYYNSTFLMRKLRNANKYCREILAGQVFMANPLFEDVFKTMMMSISGDAEILGKHGERLKLYSPIYNQNSLKSISHAAENVARFNSLMSFGPGIYKRNKKEDPDSDMLDFTENGDRVAVSERFKKLLFGNDKELSIFVRARSLIRKIKETSDTKQYVGLVSNGRILNDLLVYISPLTPTKNYPIGRMILRSSLTDNRNKDEVRLSAAFALLLLHPNEEVRKFAEDLAFYAYYSAYDLNTSNSFFHLVPPAYRKLYDASISKALGYLNSTEYEKNKIGLRAIGGIAPGGRFTRAQLVNTIAENYILTIGRNYSYDSNIVPVWKMPKRISTRKFQAYLTPSDREKGMREVVLGKTAMVKGLKTPIRTFIAFTETTSGGGYFFKLPSGILYRKIGEVRRKYRGKDGKDHNLAPYFVYAVAQRAGYKNKKLQLFELFSGYDKPSIFAENKYISSTSEDAVREEVLNVVKNNTGNVELSVVWNSSEIPDMYRSTNADMFMLPDQFMAQKNVGQQWQFGKAVSASTVYGAEYKSFLDADVILNITPSEMEHNDSTLNNIPEKFRPKVVNVALNGKGLANAIKAIKKISEGNRISITITSPIKTDYLWYKSYITDDDVDNYIKGRRSELEELFKDSADAESQIKTILDNTRDDSQHRNTMTNKKVASDFNDIFNRILLSQIEVSKVSSTMDKDRHVFAAIVDKIYLEHGNSLDFLSGELYIPSLYNLNKFARDIMQLTTVPLIQITETQKSVLGSELVEKIIEKVQNEDKPEEKTKPVSKIVLDVETSDSKKHEDCGEGTTVMKPTGKKMNNRGRAGRTTEIID